MKEPKTTIKVSKGLSRDLTIIAVLLGKNKEEFTAEIIRSGLQPYLDRVKKYRFS